MIPMKVSIVTAVFNRAATVGDTISSIQRQTYPKIEHVIQDGGSTDGTLNVIQDLATEQTLVVSAQDSGIYDAINKGIARASGDVVGLMHSDDFFAHDRVIEKVVESFSDPKVDAVFGDLDYVSANNPDKIIRHWKSGAFSRAKLARGWMPPHPTLYLRRYVFEQHGTYDTSFRIASDYDAILRFFGAAGIQSAYLPEVLVKMRVGGESNASLSRIIRKSHEDLRALRSNSVGGAGVLLLKNLRKLNQLRFR